MAYISHKKLWESEFASIVSKRDKLQDSNSNQSKLEIHDTYKKDEKITTNFVPTDETDVKNKAYLDEQLKNTNRHIAYIEKDYNEFEKQYNKQSVEEFLFQRAMKTTIQRLYDKGLLMLTSF